MKKLFALLLIGSTLGQHVAMAYDSEAYLKFVSNQSLETQYTTNRLLERINSISDEQKLRALNLVSKKLSKTSKKIERIETNKFNKAISKISNFNQEKFDVNNSSTQEVSAETEELKQIENSSIMKEIAAVIVNPTESGRVNTKIFSQINKDNLFTSTENAKSTIADLKTKTALHIKWSIDDVVHFCQSVTLITILLLIVSTIVLMIMGLWSILGIVAICALGLITLMCIIVCTLRTIDYHEFYSPIDFLFCSIIFCGMGG